MARSSLFLRIVAVILFAGAAVCAAVSLIPFESLKPMGQFLRRADDVTPERHERMVRVCLAFTAWGIVSGALLWRRRHEAASWIDQLLSDAAAAIRRSPETIRSSGAAIWVVIATGVILRAMHLNDSMAYDESYTFVNLAQQSFLIGIADYTSTNNHLLNTLLMHVSWRLFGDAEWALRLPVFLVGSALPLMIWIWGARWVGRPIALVTAALAAVSPLLITYSTDARGYILVTFAAVALDDAAARWNCGQGSKPLAWSQMVLAAGLGLCAMPIMLYALVSVAAWVIVWKAFDLGRELEIEIASSTRSPAFSEKPGISAAFARLLGSVLGNRWWLLGGGLLFCLIGGTMYAPAYIFRGTRAMSDQILKPVSLLEQGRAQLESVVGAWEWWTSGFPPGWGWAFGMVCGALFLRTTWADRVRWLALPGAMLVLHLVGQVAPPPRVYIIALPWIALVTAAGWTMMASRRGQFSRTASLVVAGVVLGGGVLYAVSHPVLIYPAERMSFVSVREALGDLKTRIEAEPGRSHRLIAPLPTDLPAVFYRERDHIAVEVNGMPGPEEVVWLLARYGETPGEVLRSPLIDIPDLESQRAPFEEVARFKTLVLYRSGPR